VRGEIQESNQVHVGARIVSVNETDTSALPLAKVMEVIANAQFDDITITFCNPSSSELALAKQQHQPQQPGDGAGGGGAGGGGKAGAARQKFELYQPRTGFMTDHLASFQVTKLSWTGNTEQVLALSALGFSLLAPKDYALQQVFRYNEMGPIKISAKDEKEFTLTMLKVPLVTS
jgi:hypothetical protein